MTNFDPYAIAAAFATVIGAAATAVRSVTKNFLTAGAAKDERFLKAMDDSQGRNEKFLGNHMSGNTAALKSVAVSLNGVVTAVGVLGEKTDRLHDDNVEQARVLKNADIDVTRKTEEQDLGATKVIAKANTKRIQVLEDERATQPEESPPVSLPKPQAKRRQPRSR